MVFGLCSGFDKGAVVSSRDGVTVVVFEVPSEWECDVAVCEDSFAIESFY